MSRVIWNNSPTGLTEGKHRRGRLRPAVAKRKKAFGETAIPEGMKCCISVNTSRK